MMPHNKFSDQRELSGLNNSAPSGRRVCGAVETDSADSASNNLLSSVRVYIVRPKKSFRILYFAGDVFLYIVMKCIHNLGNVVVVLLAIKIQIQQTDHIL